MGRRSEFTLLFILGIAGIAIVVLIWGQQTGKFTIFGDSFVPDQNRTPIVVAPDVRTPIVLVETFGTTTNNDTAATTAEWNNDASNLTIPAGQVEAKAQSRTIARVTGTVDVVLSVKINEFDGNHLYYGVSGDGGKTWLALLPGQHLTVKSVAGDWRWRAVLQRGRANASPVIRELSLTLTPS